MNRFENLYASDRKYDIHDNDILLQLTREKEK